MVRVTAPFPSVAIGLIEGGVLVMIEAGAPSVIMIKFVVGSVGMFSSLSIRETGDTILLLPSEMGIMGIIAGVMVGAVDTVVVGIVAGMGKNDHRHRGGMGHHRYGNGGHCHRYTGRGCGINRRETRCEIKGIIAGVCGVIID